MKYNCGKNVSKKKPKINKEKMIHFTNKEAEAQIGLKTKQHSHKITESCMK